MWMLGCVDGCIDECMNGSYMLRSVVLNIFKGAEPQDLDGWMDEWMGGIMHGSMHGCTVCIHSFNLAISIAPLQVQCYS